LLQFDTLWHTINVRVIYGVFCQPNWKDYQNPKTINKVVKIIKGYWNESFIKAVPSINRCCPRHILFNFDVRAKFPALTLKSKPQH
jgi:hypothetical protein